MIAASSSLMSFANVARGRISLHTKAFTWPSFRDSCAPLIGAARSRCLASCESVDLTTDLALGDLRPAVGVPSVDRERQTKAEDGIDDPDVPDVRAARALTEPVTRPTSGVVVFRDCPGGADNDGCRCV